ncbi:MAG TPA: MmgE/PrpD family protein, partial [Chloroflexota bacterium]|nr:MmgE/PrpD family protein [Chloroflexota bacterium]
HDLQWVDIPEDVQAQAIRCVLDLCGAAIAGSRTRVARIAAAYALGAHGSGAATIIGTGAGSTAVGAALANGFAASALDIDDGYRPVKGHPGAVVFGALLAAAEQAAATGADFLTGLVVAYEVAMRAGRILHPLYGFYHGTGAWGPIGAAAGAARLLGCTRQQTWHALGIAEFHAAMTPEMRSVDCPSMLKDGIGWGSMVGLTSALLAAHGFTGIPSLFDTNGPEAELADSLGHEYLIRELYAKPYACCRWAQPAVEGARAAARRLGVAAADIARVRVHTFAAALHLRSTAPRTTEEAQFSLPWPVACALVDGAVGPDQVLEHGLADPVRQALAARVEMIHDPALEGVFPQRALAWVEVEAADGRRARSEVLAARGDAEAPLSDDELSSKCTSLAEPVLGPDRARALVGAIKALPDAANLDALVALLRPTGDRRQATGDSGRSTCNPTRKWRGRTNVRRGRRSVPERR